MPAAHLPTPANLPNLNAKSAGAPSVRWRHEREDDEKRKSGEEERRAGEATRNEEGETEGI